MFDPLMDPYALEMQARDRSAEAVRRAAYDRLLRALRRSARGGRPDWRWRLARWAGALCVRLGYRLLPLGAPEAPEASESPGAARLPLRRGPEGAPGGLSTPGARDGARPGRGACRRPAARLPRGLSLAGD
jgi:hypothetical protein